MMQTKFRVFILISLGFSLGFSLPAQTIHVTDQSVFDLNPSRDALTGLTGAHRIRADFWLDPSFTDPLDVSSLLPLTLVIKSTTDDYQVGAPSSATSADPNTVWWVVPFLDAGEYELTVDPNDDGLPNPIFWRHLSVTNAPAASGDVTIIQTNIFDQGTFQTTVTNNIDVAGVVVTNTTIYEGDFSQTIITNLIDQFVGVNVFTPDLASTNVSGTWTVDLTTNAAVSIYEQTGNITSVVFNVDSTNDVALGQVLLLATTNAITWPTNGLTWADGTAPTTVSNQYNRIYFEAWRDAVFGVYVGANP
jgi:hypothetical protein